MHFTVFTDKTQWKDSLPKFNTQECFCNQIKLRILNIHNGNTDIRRLTMTEPSSFAEIEEAQTLLGVSKQSQFTVQVTSIL